MAEPSLTVDQRRELLQAEVTRYVRKGYRVMSQTDTTAQLVKPAKKPSLIMAILLGITGIGLIYLAWRWTRKDKSIYLTIETDGSIKKR